MTLVYLEGLNHREAASCLAAPRPRSRGGCFVPRASCAAGPTHPECSNEPRPFRVLAQYPCADAVGRGEGKGLHRATLAFRSRPQTAAAKPAIPWWSVIQAVGFSLGVFLVLFWLLPFDRQGEPFGAKTVASGDEPHLSESLNAVIESRGGTQVDLTAGGNETRDQPLLIEFFKKGRTVRVLSYSGRDVDLTIDGARVNVEGLLTADGMSSSQAGFCLGSRQASGMGGVPDTGPGIMRNVIVAVCLLLCAGEAYPGSVEIRPVDPRLDRNPVYSAWGGDKAAVPITITGARERPIG